MLQDPNEYLFQEKKYKHLSLEEQEKLIKYAKGQIRKYKNSLLKSKEIVLSPSPEVYIHWWEHVVSLMIVYKKSK